MERIRDWLRRGLGLPAGRNLHARTDDGPRAEEDVPAVIVAIDLLEVSGVDRGEGLADAVLVPAAWHRRTELLECVCGAAERSPLISLVVLADARDAEVMGWIATRGRAMQRAQGVRFRVEIG